MRKGSELPEFSFPASQETPEPAFISSFGEGEKHLNWTPDVALQHAGTRSGLLSSSPPATTPAERDRVLIGISWPFHLATGSRAKGCGSTGQSLSLEPREREGVFVWGVRPNDEDLGEKKKTYFEPKHAQLPPQGCLVSSVSASRAFLSRPPPPYPQPRPSPSPFSSHFLARTGVNGSRGIGLSRGRGRENQVGKEHGLLSAFCAILLQSLSNPHFPPAVQRIEQTLGASQHKKLRLKTP